MPRADPGSLARLERLVVQLIALHSAGVGLVLLLWPELGLRLGGFAAGSPLFFPRQAGAFHLVVAGGYLLEQRRGEVSLLLLTKTIAVVFLLAATLTGQVPWLVPLSGVLDGMMGLAVWRLHRATRGLA